TAALAGQRPGDVVLSEEGADNPARLGARRVWIVDPLDGTREFGEPGRSDWAVHVALWEQSAAPAGNLTAGAVALPARDTVLSTAEPPPGPPGDEAPARIRIVVSRSRPPGFVRDISGLINAELVPLGSAGAKVAAVICGEVDAYVHGGGFYEWDTAAPVAVARAAGLYASRIDGSALAYNQPDLLMPDILVCRPAVAGILLRAIREVTHAS
ncbi:MAG TPA: inositol monophosphatase family protein, partial [Streptosporangiaceae bacterium]